MMRKEWYLIAVFLVVVAGLLLFHVHQMPESSVQSLPQTEVQTTVQSGEPFRSRYAVNVNEASFDELMGVKGMTETMANGIMTHRAEYGRIFSLDELLKLPGFGKATLEKVRPYLCTE